MSIHIALAIPQINQCLHNGNDVFLAQSALCVFSIQLQTHVHFHAANRGKIIAL